MKYVLISDLSPNQCAPHDLMESITLLVACRFPCSTLKFNDSTDEVH